MLILKKSIAVNSFWGLISKEAKIFGPPDRRLLHETNRLTAIHRFHQGDFLRPVDDHICQFIQQFLSNRTRHTTPVCESYRRGFAGPIYISLGSLNHRTKRTVICRRQVLESYRVFRHTEITIDEMAWHI